MDKLIEFPLVYQPWTFYQKNGQDYTLWKENKSFVSICACCKEHLLMWFFKRAVASLRLLHTLRTWTQSLTTSNIPWVSEFIFSRAREKTAAKPRKRRVKRREKKFCPNSIYGKWVSPLEWPEAWLSPLHNRRCGYLLICFIFWTTGLLNQGRSNVKCDKSSTAANFKRTNFWQILDNKMKWTPHDINETLRSDIAL